MRHTRKGVTERTLREFRLLDRLVKRLNPADWRRHVPRPETRDPWTVKDALAHILYWKEHSSRSTPSSTSDGAAAGRPMCWPDIGGFTTTLCGRFAIDRLSGSGGGSAGPIGRATSMGIRPGTGSGISRLLSDGNRRRGFKNKEPPTRRLTRTNGLA